jgi:hypothetical protein
LVCDLGHCFNLQLNIAANSFTGDFMVSHFDVISVSVTEAGPLVKRSWTADALKLYRNTTTSAIAIAA